MKYILLLILVSAICFVACQTKIKHDNMQVIPFYTEMQKQMMDSTHKAGDVDVFCIAEKDTVFYLRVYRTESGEVRRYETTIRGNQGFDKSAHQWLNDSTVLFHLLNSGTSKQQDVQLSGSGAITTVQ